MGRCTNFSKILIIYTLCSVSVGYVQAHGLMHSAFSMYTDLCLPGGNGSYCIWSSPCWCSLVSLVCSVDHHGGCGHSPLHSLLIQFHFTHFATSSEEIVRLIHPHTCTHTHTHTHTHAHPHTLTHAHTHTYMYTDTRTLGVHVHITYQLKSVGELN